MADFYDTVDQCSTFAKALNALSHDGAYDPDERNGFGLLHLMYSAALTSFATDPVDGTGTSARYDRVRDEGAAGQAAAAVSAPGDGPSQQPVYDAAHDGAKALRAATGHRFTAPLKAPALR